MKENREIKKDIQYNSLQDGMEKVCIYDCHKLGIERMFKSIRHVYDNYGIEISRNIEMLQRDDERVKTTYSYKDRIKDKPNIIKITNNSKPTKENGKVSYYDISKSSNIQNLDENDEDKIDESDIKELTSKEKEKIIERINPIYKQGMGQLLGIGIGQEYR